MPRVALVVDDSMLIRHTVCRFLEERGFQVESATNGLEALEVLKTVQPDLIVTDLMMPKMTGSELITVLKESEKTANIPIIVLAAHRTAAGSEEETRAQHLVYKDIDIEAQLQRAVDELGRGL